MIKYDIRIQTKNVGNKRIAKEIISEIEDLIQDTTIQSLYDIDIDITPYVKSYIEHMAPSCEFERYKVTANSINNPVSHKLPLQIEISYKRPISEYPTVIKFIINELKEEQKSDDFFAPWKR